MALHFFVQLSTAPQKHHQRSTILLQPQTVPPRIARIPVTTVAKASLNLGGTYEIPGYAHAWSVASRRRGRFGVRARLPGRPSRVRQGRRRRHPGRRSDADQRTDQHQAFDASPTNAANTFSQTSTRATTRVKATLQGYKTVDRGGIRIGTQQFLALDLTLEVGAITENVTVTGQAPLIDTVERVDRHDARFGGAADAAVARPQRVHDRRLGADGRPAGDAQFNRQQDQTNASLMSLGGGTRRGNNYTLDGVPITDMRNRMSAVPTTEGVEDLKVQVHTYDAEMGRTGGGVFNMTAKSGTNNFHGTGFFQTRPIWGQTNNYFSQIASDVAAARRRHEVGGGQRQAEQPVLPGRRRLRRTDREGPHVLLVLERAVPRRADAQQRGAHADRGRAHRRLLRPDQQRRPAVLIYDPLTKLPFPGNVIPANRINPVAAAMIKYLPLPDTNWTTAQPTTTGPR